MEGIPPIALVSCPECGKSVSDRARACPNCGYPIKPDESRSTGSLLVSGYEYRSAATIFGMPLVHIVYGPGYGGISKPAKGFIAIGNIAIGVIAIGVYAIGGLSIGTHTLYNDPQLQDYLKALVGNVQRNK